ncbi:protein adenylyltransferase SelO [Corticimicrobacter populi]|uniref:Protein nucleotidyltransferase YdiU n=1 Tax=Corticimicrobacter populi TaxID=2175229 RepID=A0A2V1K1U6_9BURK|nr:YdiU family protein [Corticimicrobacter populi]PWF23205.1 YdiU family protein [Corticimicrobacter populi]
MSEVSLATSLQDLHMVNSFAGLPDAFYTRLPPRPLTDPVLLHANAAAARSCLGLSPAALQTPAFLDAVSGAAPWPGGDCLAAVYSGHQFGVWAGQLGDGRAHLLGEVDGPDGGCELQLKGAGRTPYSRMGDGRAVLRSSVREYLASEAMHGLGIPTTRALALVGGSNMVQRETPETAAIVLRLAPSFIRFGSFEHWAAQRRPDLLATLTDYVIDRFYPACRDKQTGDAENGHKQAGPVLALLRQVSRRTGELMAAWQSVGFCHGVMNTDNMSILGLTLDYGPYGFMDGFDIRHVCNHSDTQGRYAWHAQPAVAQWNLLRLANALFPLVEDEAALRDALGTYETAFMSAFQQRMAAKLGLQDWDGEGGDDVLLDDLWKLMHSQQADFTLTFRRLADVVTGEPGNGPLLVNDDGLRWDDHFADREPARHWLARYRQRLGRDGRPDAERAEAMNRVNPLYVLRNYMAEQAIRQAQAGDTSEIDRLMRLLAHPFAAQSGYERYAEPPPDWAGGISVSCSS